MTDVYIKFSIVAIFIQKIYYRLLTSLVYSLVARV